METVVSLADGASSGLSGRPCGTGKADDVEGLPLQSVVHPDDAPLLLLALGRSSVERRGVATGLRVRSRDGAWTPVRCEVSPLCEHNPPRFAVAMWSRPVARRGVLRAARGAPGGPPLA